MPTKITASKPAEDVDRYSAKKEAFLSMTGAQIDTYIDNNVNSLADAKRVLKLLARAVRYALK